VKAGFLSKRETSGSFWESRSRWEDTIKINRQEISFENVGCIHLAHDSDQWQAVVNMVMKLRVSYNEHNFFTSLASSSRRTLLHGVS
jgi:hypothetical protein